VTGSPDGYAANAASKDFAVSAVRPIREARTRSLNAGAYRPRAHIVEADPLCGPGDTAADCTPSYAASRQTQRCP
jgi:hypothetical protein